jgi:capsular polysaccharide biosynthesis protein
MTEWSRVLSSVRQRIYLAIFAMIALGSIVYAWSNGQPSAYHASALITVGVRTTTTANDGSTTIADSVKQAAAFAQRGIGDDVLAQLPQSLVTAPVSELRARIHIAAVADQPLISVSVESPTADDAIQLANSVAFLLVQSDTEFVTATAAKTVKELEGEVAALSTNIVQTQSAIASSQAKGLPIASLVALLAQQRARLAELNRQLAQAQVNLAQVQPEFWVASRAQAAVKTGPDVLVNTASASLAGLLIGAGLAMLVALMDGVLRSEVDVKRLIGMDTLAMIPDLSGGEDVYQALTSAMYERSHQYFRQLLLNVRFLGVSHPAQALLVVPQERDATDDWVALNLAITCAVAGERTLAIDANFDRPSLRLRMQIPETDAGIFTVLAEIRGDPTSLMRAVSVTGVPLLTILPVGPIAPKIDDLFNDDLLHRLILAARQSFDRIIVLAPNNVVDGPGSRLIEHMDSVLVVARAGSTMAAELTAQTTAIRRQNGRLAGIVLLDVASARSDQEDLAPKRARRGTKTSAKVASAP